MIPVQRYCYHHRSFGIVTRGGGTLGIELFQTGITRTCYGRFTGANLNGSSSFDPSSPSPYKPGILTASLRHRGPWITMHMMLFFTMYSSRCASFIHILCLLSPLYLIYFEFAFLQTQGDAWFKPSGDNVAVGVCLRVNPGEFRVFPYENHYLVPFESAVRLLNPVVAVKMRSAAVHSALATMSVADQKVLAF